ncbi:MAG: magnesium transporter [Gammaproteobacteria bacterium]
MGTTSQLEPQALLQRLNEALGSGIFTEVRQLLSSLLPVDIAHLIESSPPHVRAILWKLIDTEDEAEVLQHLGEEVRAQQLIDRNPADLANLLHDLDTDDIADLLQEMPRALTQNVLASMDAQDRHRVEAVLNFADDTAGGLMNTDTISIRPNISLDIAIRYLRRHQALPPTTDSLIVVNRRDHYVGLLPLAKLLVTDPSVTVREAMDTELEAIRENTSASEVASLFERLDLVSAPVVDTNGKLLGRITIDDVVDVIRQEADHNIMSTVGLDEEEDTFAPVLKSSRSRATWLGINLLTAFLASAVIGLFQETLQAVVALAVLMPIVASMGGIAGSQTLTLVIRGIALGRIGIANARWVIARECGVGLVNGVLWALIVGVTASLWFGEELIGYLIGTAMLVNLIIAAIAGAGIPIIMKRINIDPAIAGGVVLTTITDITGFLCFLGLASLFYTS